MKNLYPGEYTNGRARESPNHRRGGVALRIIPTSDFEKEQLASYAKDGRRWMYLIKY